MGVIHYNQNLISPSEGIIIIQSDQNIYGAPEFSLKFTSGEGLIKFIKLKSQALHRKRIAEYGEINQVKKKNANLFI